MHLYFVSDRACSCRTKVASQTCGELWCEVRRTRAGSRTMISLKQNTSIFQGERESKGSCCRCSHRGSYDSYIAAVQHKVRSTAFMTKCQALSCATFAFAAGCAKVNFGDLKMESWIRKPTLKPIAVGVKVKLAMGHGGGSCGLSGGRCFQPAQAWNRRLPVGSSDDYP